MFTSPALMQWLQSSLLVSTFSSSKLCWPPSSLHPPRPPRPPRLMDRHLTVRALCCPGGTDGVALLLPCPSCWTALVAPMQRFTTTVIAHVQLSYDRVDVPRYMWKNHGLVAAVVFSSPRGGAAGSSHELVPVTRFTSAKHSLSGCTISFSANTRMLLCEPSQYSAPVFESTRESLQRFCVQRLTVNSKPRKECNVMYKV